MTPRPERDWEKEEKKRQAKRTELLNAHLREIQRKKSDAFNIGSYEDENAIMSKTDKGRMTTSRHPDTGKISHVWHDEFDHRVEPSGTGHRANKQMRDTSSNNE